MTTGHVNLYGLGGDYVSLRLIQLIEEHDWQAVASRTWQTERRDLTDVNVNLEVAGGNGRISSLVTYGEDGAAVVSRKGDDVEVTAAAKKMDGAKIIIEQLGTLLPRVEPKEDGTVSVRFWYAGNNGPQAVTRKLAAPLFDDIRENYATGVRRSLDRLISDKFVPGKGGQLILWHGLPGTGKSYALRALARGWAKWCQIDYVVDPEAFFGRAAYLMQTLLRDEDDEYGPTDDEDPRKGWRLLIFEDTGELLSADARERAGQGLSRLLNTVDGFLGQGLRTLILITTNEELSSLHPAVSRPGRCAATVPFTALDTVDARRWAEANGLDRSEISGTKTLAELFALRDGFEKAEERRVIGFRGAA